MATPNPPKPVESYLRPHQIDELKADINGMEAMLANPNAKLEDKAATSRSLSRMKQGLEKQSPPDLNGEQRDKISKRELELREQIKEGMPSKREMRQSPSGAIDKHQRWEKRNKRKMQVWKNLRLALNKGDDSTDIANFERFRPTKSTLNLDDGIVNVTDYDIPSEQFKENYDDIDWGTPNEPSGADILLAEAGLGDVVVTQRESWLEGELERLKEKMVEQEKTDLAQNVERSGDRAKLRMEARRQKVEERSQIRVAEAQAAVDMSSIELGEKPTDANESKIDLEPLQDDGSLNLSEEESDGFPV
jgi:hypothetical protein